MSDVLWRRVAGGRVLHAFEERRAHWFTPPRWYSACDGFRLWENPPDRGDLQGRAKKCKLCLYEIEGKAS